MKRLRTESCGIPPETSFRVGSLHLNQHLGAGFWSVFLCSICGIRLSTQIYSFWRIAFLLTFSSFGNKSYPSSWNGNSLIRRGLVSFDPSWKNPPRASGVLFCSPLQGAWCLSAHDPFSITGGSGLLQTVFLAVLRGITLWYPPRLLVHF